MKIKIGGNDYVYVKDDTKGLVGGRWVGHCDGRLRSRPGRSS